MRHENFQSLGNGSFHRIAYTDWGSIANSHVVVCVHGLARNSRDFDFLAAALTPECRVVCMDVAGRGESEWLDSKSYYTFATYQSDAAAMLARASAPTRRALLRMKGYITRGMGAPRAPRRTARGRRSIPFCAALRPEDRRRTPAARH